MRSECPDGQEYAEYRREKMREHRRNWKVAHRAQSNALETKRQTTRYRTDPEYRERVKWRQRLRRYGLSHEQFVEMYSSQDGLCEVCRSEMLPGHDTCIDHDHATGTVRALLCNGCNTALGFARDDPERLRALAAYIERHLEGGDAL